LIVSSSPDRSRIALNRSSSNITGRLHGEGQQEQEAQEGEKAQKGEVTQA
jgi:hypothetical protein